MMRKTRTVGVAVPSVAVFERRPDEYQDPISARAKQRTSTLSQAGASTQSNGPRI